MLDPQHQKRERGENFLLADNNSLIAKAIRSIQRFESKQGNSQLLLAIANYY